MQDIEGRSSYHGQTQQEGTRTRGSDLVPAEQNGLFKYRKGGKGALLKCFIDDAETTQETTQDTQRQRGTPRESSNYPSPK